MKTTKSHMEELEALLEELQRECRKAFSWRVDSGILWDKGKRPYAFYLGGFTAKMDVEVRAYSRRWILVNKQAGTWNDHAVFKGQDALSHAMEYATTY